MNEPEIARIAALPSARVVFYSGEVYEWHNSNRLLSPQSEYYCPFADGIKTGTTENAGNCLAAQFFINGKRYITVAAGCETDDDRYVLTLALINKYT